MKYSPYSKKTVCACVILVKWGEKEEEENAKEA
jgi:hypothetical protein